MSVFRVSIGLDWSVEWPARHMSGGQSDGSDSYKCLNINSNGVLENR